jgi:aryl-alcohol dehydrogenase-like predicted oxidoreductase
VRDTGLLTTTLGRSGLEVTRLGLGLAALGRPAYITLGRQLDLGADRDQATMERRCHDMLDAAYAAGIRYVDTARSYGRAEEFLASWLRGRRAEPADLTIGSKWGYRYTGAWNMRAVVHETKDLSLAMFRAQLPLTMELLGRHLDLYQVHSATLESGVLDDPAVLHALAELSDSGVAVGLTVSGPRQADVVRHAQEVEVEGVNPFSTVQATWNVLESSVGPALHDAHARGWGVLVKEALANGRLTDRGDHRSQGALEAVATRHGASVDQVAIAAALAQPWADVVLSGAVTPLQLESNIAALDLPLSQEDREELESVTEDPAAYWDRRGALPWQ